MKQSKIIIFALAIFCAGVFTSCSRFIGNGITGNGHVVTKDIKINPFNQLDIVGIFKQGSKEAVVIEADENIAKLIEVKSDNNILSVHYKDEVN